MYAPHESGAQDGTRLTHRSLGMDAAFGSWLMGLRASLPVVLGYLPASVAFGVVARGAGLDGLASVAVSAGVFAGASQFALVGLLGAGAGPWTAAMTALALNVRHVVYGPVLAPLLRGCTGVWRAVLAFGLTDEVFAAAAAQLRDVPEGARRHWLLGLATGAYAAWVLGTWMGAAGGSALLTVLPRLGSALTFALPALFLVLLLPFLRGSGGVAAAAAVLGTLPLHAAGNTGAGVMAGAALGVATGLLWERLARGRARPEGGGDAAVEHPGGGPRDLPDAAAAAVAGDSGHNGPGCEA